MNDSSDRLLDRVGAAAGIAVFALFLAIVMVAPALPAPNRSIEAIARAAADDATGILLGSYLGALMSGALLVFGASLAARMRRAEAAGGGWWLIALAGISATAVGLATDAIVTTFVRSVGHGVRGATLWIGYPSGPDGVLIAIPLAVFFLGAGLGARSTAILPRWLGNTALALAALFVVGAGSVTGSEVDGGVLGLPLLLGYLGLLVWIVSASISLWRGATVARSGAVVLQGAES